MRSGARVCKSCRSRQELSNEHPDEREALGQSRASGLGARAFGRAAAVFADFRRTGRVFFPMTWPAIIGTMHTEPSKFVLHLMIWSAEFFQDPTKIQTFCSLIRMKILKDRWRGAPEDGLETSALFLSRLRHSLQIICTHSVGSKFRVFIEFCILVFQI